MRAHIAWAQRLEEAGVRVVYARRDQDALENLSRHPPRGGELRRYVHLSTGNYNAKTARLYTDIDLLTADTAIAEDAAQLLNLITGDSAETAQEMFTKHSREWRWRKQSLRRWSTTRGRCG
jgi:polyphosphate kinase